MEKKLESGKRLIVIGGGAAGFFCAVNAARMNTGLEVILLEKTNKLLSKVKISGGGRCNVTHACFDIGLMSRQYPRGSHFIKKTFHQFFTSDTISWFKERGVWLKTEKDGRMFPVTDSSQSVIECIMKEANKYEVEIRMNAEVKKIILQENSSGRNAGKFNILISGGRNLQAEYICVACGGYPKTQMFDWLLELGHSIEEPVPSLFTFNLPGNPISKLMGVSAEKVRVKIPAINLEESGPLLITHWGLSGPVILRLSAWGARELAKRNWHFSIRMNWIPDFNEQVLRKKFQEFRISFATQKIINKNPFGLASRLWNFLLMESGIKNETRCAELQAGEQNRLIKNLCAFECNVKGKSAFKEEFVTAGGIRLGEVDANTMMSKKIPNLFFAGEILDVDGITGGYNFQHAWTSGFIAGKTIAQLARD